MTEVGKVTGRIIKISETGWGFISSKDIKFTRIFFHWTHLRQDTLSFPELHTGMTVEFTPVKLPDKGYRAVHIRVTDDKRTAVKESGDAEATPIELGDLPALPK